jgi:predicted  nucleic acid-binding Zn-ribbon protein
MLFPQDNRSTTNTGAGTGGSAPAPASQPQQQYQPPQQQQYQPQPIMVQAPSSGIKIPILFGAVIALVGACVYLFYQINQLRSDIADTRDSLAAQISKLSEESSVSVETSRRNIESLEKDLAKSRAQAAQLSGEAKSAALQHADEVAARLQRAQDEQSKQIATMGTEVTQVKSDASAANNKIDEVSGQVSNVKTDVAKNRADTEKLVADMKSARGDLGVQSGLIATNAKELAALRELGERNYTEFKIAKTKKPERVGDLMIRLAKADAKHNQYTIYVTADDKTFEKKDRTINEPVQFILARATQPYELVVNDIKKDLIVGYVSSPKVQQPRGSGSTASAKP